MLHVVGHSAEREQVVGLQAGAPVRQVQPLAGPDLLPDRGEPRVPEADLPVAVVHRSLPGSRPVARILPAGVGTVNAHGLAVASVIYCLPMTPEIASTSRTSRSATEYLSPGRTVTEADIVAFAGLSGDYNVLHTDAEFMRTSIFGERIAHGLLGLSISSGLGSRAMARPFATLAFLGSAGASRGRSRSATPSRSASR